MPPVTPQTVKRAVAVFEKAVATREAVLALSACVHCGLCADACHYYRATGDPRMVPAYKADRVRRLAKHPADWLGRLVPTHGAGAPPLTDQELTELKDIAFGSCTLCRRCTINCRFGIDNALLIRTARGVLAALGMAPEGFRAAMRDQRVVGNQMGISQADYLETIEWLEREAQVELGPDFRVPIDKAGAEIVYVIDPREVKYRPLSLLAAFKIFHWAGTDWTMPGLGWDGSNFGLFSGDDDLGAHMGRLVFDHARTLGVKKVVLSDCGAGYRAMRWESPNWVKTGALPFAIESLLETMASYAQEGRLVLNPAKNPYSVTYHDPCNLARSAGITEEPRFLLQHACLEFREMHPNREDTCCCAGGGGAMAMAEYASRRRAVARVKADQIRATGAGVVATACHDCVDSLTDLIHWYDMDLQVKNVVEIVADACVSPVERRADARRPILAGLEGRRILIVGDEPDGVRTLSAFLSAQGFVVSTARGATEALAQAAREKPDLISLDIRTPGESGVALFMALRRDPRVQSVPVLIIGGAGDLRKLIYSRGVRPPEGYTGRRTDPGALLMTVRRLLEIGH